MCVVSDSKHGCFRTTTLQTSCSLVCVCGVSAYHAVCQAPVTLSGFHSLCCMCWRNLGAFECPMESARLISRGNWKCMKLFNMRFHTSKISQKLDENTVWDKQWESKPLNVFFLVYASLLFSCQNCMEKKTLTKYNTARPLTRQYVNWLSKTAERQRKSGESGCEEEGKMNTLAPLGVCHVLSLAPSPRHVGAA